MAATAKGQLSIATSVTDGAAKGMRQAQESVKKLADEAARSDDKLKKSGEGVAKAKNAQLSASKQVALAVKAEAAATKPLQTQLIKLEREYLQIEANMRAVVKAGGQVDASMAKQAASARNAIAQIKANTAAVKRREAAIKREAATVEEAAVRASALAARQTAKATAEREAASASAGLSRAIKGQVGQLLALGAGVAAARKAYAFLVTDVVETGNRLDKVSSKLGINVEALQELRFAAQKTGVEQNTLDMALQRFTRRAAEAANGTGEAKAALEEMGIQLRDSDGNLRSVEDLLGDVADGMKGAKTDGDRLRLAFKLFDSEGAALVNTLGDGNAALEAMRKEARDTGSVLDANLVAASVRATDEMQRLDKSIDGLGKVLSQTLVPILADKVLPALTNVVQATSSGFLGDLGFLAFTKATGSAEEYAQAVKDVAASWDVALTDIESRIARTKKILEDNPVELVPLVDEPVKKTKKQLAEELKAREEARKRRLAMQEEARRQLLALANLEAAESREAAAKEEAARLAEIEAVRRQLLTLANLERSDEAERQKRADDAAKADLERRKKLNDERKKLAEDAAAEEERREAERDQFVISAAENIIGIWGRAFNEIASGSEDADKQILQAAKSTAMSIITIATSKAAAEAIAAHSGIPFVGVAIGLAAAGAAATAILSAVQFAAGGEVTGGVPGRDSVPALLTPGEIVLPVTLARQFKALIGEAGGAVGGAAPLPAMVQRMADGGTVERAGADRGITVVINWATLGVPDRAATDRMVRDTLLPAIARSQRAGF